MPRRYRAIYFVQTKGQVKRVAKPKIKIRSVFILKFEIGNIKNKEERIRRFALVKNRLVLPQSVIYNSSSAYVGCRIKGEVNVWWQRSYLN